MNRIGKSLVIFALLAGCSLHARLALAANCTSIASGAWNATTTWGPAATGCAGAVGGIPGAADNVTIGAATLVTVTAAAFSNTITIAASTGTNGISIIGANTLTNASDFTMNGGVAAGNASIVDVGSGTLKSGGIALKANAGAGPSTVGVGSGSIVLNAAANITMTGGAAATAIALLTVSTGTISASSINFLGTVATSKLTSTGASNITVTGNIGAGGTLTTSGTGTITFNGSAAETMAAYATYNNVVVSNTGSTVTLGGAATVGGTLNVNSGILITAGALTINGATTVASGATLSNASGTLTLKGAATISGTLTAAAPVAANSTFTVNGTSTTTAAAATGTFIGLVTVNPGGTWNNAGNSTVTFEGGITNNGNIFAGGTGQQTFSVNSQTLAGSSAINLQGIAITGAITVTNNNTSAVTVPGDILGSVAGSAWVQGPNSTLNCGGPTGCSISSVMLTASAAGNTVNYNSTLPPRNVVLPTGSPAAYYNLVLGGTGAHTMPSAAMTILNNLTFNGSGSNATALGALTIGGSLTIGAGTTFNGGTGFTHTISGSVSNSGTFNGGTSSYNITGNFTNNTGGTVSFPAPGGGTVSLAGNFTNNGTFTSTSGTFVFNGSTAQTITGTNGGSTTFNQLTLNNAQGLSIIGTHNVTVGNPSPVMGGVCPGSAPVLPTVLTLTSGQFATGANVLTIGNSSAIAGAGGSKFVVGNLSKSFFKGPSETMTFEVGTGTSYAPLSIFLTCVTAASKVTVTTTAGDHPQIGSSTIDSFQSVNRYWPVTLLPAAIPWFSSSASNQVTFNYTAADIDPVPTNPANFIVSGYYGASGWTAYAPSSAGATSLVWSGIGITSASLAAAFQIGDAGASVPPPSSFNAFESATPANMMPAVIHTKIAGDAIPGSINTSLDVVALSATNTVLTGFFGAVTVDVVGNTALGVPIGGNNCPTSSTTIETITANFVAANNGRLTIALPAVANVWRDVRLRMSYPAGAPTVTVCSSDNFAIRPYLLLPVATDSDWQTAGTVRALGNSSAIGGIVHRAGQPFTLSATAQNFAGAATSQYAGSPTIVAGSPTCILPSPCTLQALTLSVWTATAGVVTSTPVTYPEVGAIGLQLEDQTFASVDATDGSSFIIPQWNGSAFGAITIGRFVPDSFTVVTSGTAPSIATFGVADTACSAAAAAPKRSFTYIGQPFGYVAANPPTIPAALVPQVTVTAINATGGTTTNYQGALWKITSNPVGAVTCQTAVSPPSCTATQGGVSQTYQNNALGAQAFDPAQVQILAPTVTPGAAAATYGTGTVVINSADLLAFLRSPNVPSAPFNPILALDLSVSDNSELGPAGNGTINTSTNGGTGAIFNPLVFDSGNLFYYGQMQMSNANGSEILPLRVPVVTQFFNGAVFQTNGADNCTRIVAANVGLGDYQPPTFAGKTAASIVNPGGQFLKGQNNVQFSAPGSGITGALDLVIGLGATNVINTCRIAAWTPGTPTPTGANLAFLRSAQNVSPACSGGVYNQDPIAHATFGTNNINQNAIYQRENY